MSKLASFVLALALGACAAASPDVAPRVIATPIREEARLALPPTGPNGWRLAVIADAERWEALTRGAGFQLAGLHPDFDDEVVVIASQHMIGGAVGFSGFERAGARGRFEYSPSATFGPAWADAGALALAVAVPRGELEAIDFVRGGRVDQSLPIP